MNKHLLSPTTTDEPVNVGLVDLAWLAGLLEGEGSFSTTWKQTKNGPWPIIVISCKMTDQDVIERIRTVTSAGRVSGPHVYRTSNFVKKAEPKPVWCWQLSRRNQVFNLCKQLLPLMGQRRQCQIQKLIGNYEAALHRRKGQDVHNHSTYVNRGCRCEVCRAAYSAYMKKMPSRKRG